MQFAITQLKQHRFSGWLGSGVYFFLLAAAYTLARISALPSVSDWTYLILAAAFAVVVVAWLAWTWRDPSEGRHNSEFRRLVQSSVDRASFSIMWTDLSGRFLYTNEAASQLLGYSPEEFRTMSVLDLDLDTSEQMLRDSLKCTKETGEMVFESSHRKKDGTIVPVEIAVRHLEFERKDVFCCFCRDITDRKLAEGALRVAHDQSELFLNAVPSILIALDHTGRIERWNLAAANIFGLAEWAVRGRPLGACGVEWSRPDLDDLVASWLTLSRQLRYDDLQFNKQGEKHFLGLTINPITRDDGQNSGLLIAGADTTERRHLEDGLRQAQKLEAVGQLAAGIAHEINTPTQYVTDNTTFLKDSWASVGEILALAQTLQAESPATSPETAIDRLRQSAQAADLGYLLQEVPLAIAQSLDGLQRIAQIVRAMKEFSHPGSAEKIPTDINKAIETTITVARNEWKYVAEMVTDFDATLPAVPCFVGEFNQVILNLIVNAAHAIRDAGGEEHKGKITIATRHHGHSATVIISDTGAGIPEAIRSRIFEPFFTTKQVGKGTGQGLALAHSVIVKKHAGTIRFDSEIGKGTTFFIRLPLAPPVVVEAAPAAKA